MSEIARPTVLVVHGYSLGEHPKLQSVVDKGGVAKPRYFGDWEHVCIGDGTLLGRIPRALEVARERKPTLVIWSTAASWVGGTSEARFMFECALKMLRVHPFSPSSLAVQSLFEENSTNTSTCLAEVKKILDEQFGDEPLSVVHVTSKNHRYRVLRDADIAMADRPRWWQEGIPADTSYGNKGPRDVTIQENTFN